MTGPVAEVAVILPTFNRRELCRKAVDSVLAQTLSPRHLLILNNASTDGTQEELEAVARARPPELFPRIWIHQSPENLGASRGFRFLFEKALELKPEWVWVMDDDAIAAPDALEKLFLVAEARDPRTAVLESSMVDQNGVWIEAYRPARFNPERFEFTGVPAEEALSGKAIAVNTGPFCGLLIRRDVFEEFGFPRDELFMWLDDTEYLMRVSARRGVYVVPKSRIRHFGQALVPQEVRWPFSGPLPKIPLHLLWRYYYLQRNWLWLGKQWLPPGKYAAFFAKNVIRNFAAPVLFRQEKILRRWRLSARAAMDAVLDRLGKRVDPGS